jgi:hypothetical protein
MMNAFLVSIILTLHTRLGTMAVLSNRPAALVMYSPHCHSDDPNRISPDRETEIMRRVGKGREGKGREEKRR